MHAEPPGGVPELSGVPEKDARIEPRHFRTECRMTAYGTKAAWEKRAASLRKQILVSAGLWSMPAKTPLNAQIFGKIEKEDYTIEKVYFESYPGFYVTGNLYRPRGKKGPFPGILSPHGHWSYGRLENSERGSVPARAVQLARQGAVVFTYDMVGYNDSFQVPHRFQGDREELWGINLLGLQLWNSIRATDFLASLLDVDPNRLSCTGASGGGTQTFLLTAVDDRIKVSAPVNMISAHMQGGDICENAPNLRIETCNVEIGALMAPRPLMIVSSTGDWTMDTPRIEYPSIRGIFELYGTAEKVGNYHQHAVHNYNRNSREAVYTWFEQWVFGKKPAGKVKEQGWRLEYPSDLLVFYGREKPKEAKTTQQLVDYLIGSARKKIESLKPRNKKGLENFKKAMGPALRYSLMAEIPDASNVAVETKSSSSNRQELVLSYKGSRVEAVFWKGKGKGKGKAAVLVAHPEGASALEKGKSGTPGKLVSGLVKAGFSVLAVKPFPTPMDRKWSDNEEIRQKDYFTTYNRTDAANRVQDILTSLGYLKGRSDVTDVSLVGLEQAGLSALLARSVAPGVKRLVADAAQFEAENDQAYLRDFPIPGIRRAGDFRTAVALAAPGALLVHNTGKGFSTTWAEDVYKASGAKKSLTVKAKKVSENEIIRWLRGR